MEGDLDGGGILSTKWKADILLLSAGLAVLGIYLCVRYSILSAYLI
jgi:hypothetical protein